MIAVLTSLEGLDGLVSRLANNIGIDVIGAARVVGQDDDLVVVNLGLTAGNDHTSLAAALSLSKLHANDPVAEGDDLGRMAGIDAQLTGIRNEHEAGRRALIEGPVGTNELYVQLCHCLTWFF